MTSRETNAAPKISVLLPVYNAAPYLEAALDSVLAQSFTAFEFLAHDDGSTDGSWAILERYARTEVRMHISRAKNAGLIATLNDLIAKAQAPLLARMDADDVCLATRFEAQVRYFETYPDCVALGSPTIEMDVMGRMIGPIFPPKDHAEIDVQHLMGCTSLLHPTVMMRRDAVHAVGGYDPTMPSAEDIDLWLRLAEVGRLANLETPHLHYRIHENSISTRYNAEQRQTVQRACEAAQRRRGLTPSSVESSDHRRPLTDKTRTAAYIRTGWRAWRHGYRDTWRHYAGRALRAAPFSLAAWKLVILGWLRRPKA